MTRRLELSEVERTTLEQAVKHHPKAYARERAAALVKVADRTAAAWVAEHGLLMRRTRRTRCIGGWIGTRPRGWRR